MAIAPSSTVALPFACVAAMIGICLAWPAAADPGDIQLVSTNVSGDAVDGGIVSMSPDGRFVLLGTNATNVVPGGNPPGHIRIDRLLGTKVFALGWGMNRPTISADGRFVAFGTWEGLIPSDTNGSLDIYVRDLETQRLVRASVGPNGAQPNDYCDFPMISANGRYVTFYSFADNLVANDTNGTYDVFVRDLQAGVTERVSVNPAGGDLQYLSWDPTISADGRFVVFDSMAPNAVAGDTNHATDVFVRDRVLGVTERVSVNSAGVEGNRESYGSQSSVSADGRYVTFQSAASNLAPGDTNGATDVFVRDRQLGITERISVSSTGAEGNSSSQSGPVSGNGRIAVFISSAPNLVDGDLNGRDDVFVRDRLLQTTVRANVSWLGVQSNGEAYAAYVTADGKKVFFNDSGTNLVDVPTPPEVSKAYMRELGGLPGSDVPFVLEPKALELGATTIDMDSNRSFIFTNTGRQPISITTLTVTGANAPLFTATHSCGTSVAVGDACPIVVRFRPTSVGAKSAALDVATPAGTQTVTMAGTGVRAQVSLSVSTISFSPRAVGTQSSDRSVKVQNTGQTPAPIRWIGITGADKADFERLRWCPAVLAPGGVCHAPVRFQPSSAGDKSAQLVVSPGNSGPPKYVALSGTGI